MGGRRRSVGLHRNGCINWIEMSPRLCCLGRRRGLVDCKALGEDCDRIVPCCGTTQCFWMDGFSMLKVSIRSGICIYKEIIISSHISSCVYPYQIFFVNFFIYANHFPTANLGGARS